MTDGTHNNLILNSYTHSQRTKTEFSYEDKELLRIPARYEAKTLTHITVYWWNGPPVGEYGIKAKKMASFPYLF